jgi:hypothetical protein
MFRAAAAASLLALAASATVSYAQSSPHPPETMATALPAAWDGADRKPVQVEKRKSYGAEYATVSSHYRSGIGKSPAFELVLRITDMGPEGGKMYRDYGADYLKTNVASETEKSVTVAGRRGLRTTTSKDSLTIVTFVEPRILVEASCIKADETTCLKALERVDLARLAKLAP